jgi:hypothetical protein
MQQDFQSVSHYIIEYILALRHSSQVSTHIKESFHFHVNFSVFGIESRM